MFLSLIFWRFWRKDSIKKVVGIGVLYMLIIAVVLGGVHHRNYTQYQSTSFVSHTGSHLLNWVVPATYQYSGQGSYKDGQKLAKLRLQLKMQQDQVNSLPQNVFKSSSYQASVAKDILLEFGFIKILKAWAVGSTINLFAPSIAYAPVVRLMDHPSFYEMKGDGGIEKIWNYVNNSNSKFYLIVLSINAVISVLFLLLAFTGMVKLYKTLKHNKESTVQVIFIMLLMLVIYFMAVTGPIIGVKYRLPIEPILTLFASYFISGLTFKYFFNRLFFKKTVI
jgi:hypothetical protein